MAKLRYILGTSQFVSTIKVATVRERHDDSTTTCKDKRTKTYGDKQFDKTASTFGNNLSSETRNEQSLDIFKKNVKTYLFRIAYL